MRLEIATSLLSPWLIRFPSAQNMRLHPYLLGHVASKGSPVHLAALRPALMGVHPLLRDNLVCAISLDANSRFDLPTR